MNDESSAAHNTLPSESKEFVMAVQSWHSGWLVDANVARAGNREPDRGDVVEGGAFKVPCVLRFVLHAGRNCCLYCWRELAARRQTLVAASCKVIILSPLFIENLGAYKGTLILRKPHLRKTLHLLYQSSIAFQQYLQKLLASGDLETLGSI